MLRIKKDVDIKELEKYGIYPKYECNEKTGKTRIYALDTSEFSFRKLIFKKNRKRIAKIYSRTYNDWFLKLEEDTKELVDLDILYDLIKDGLVEKVK